MEEITNLVDAISGCLNELDTRCYQPPFSRAAYTIYDQYKAVIDMYTCDINLVADAKSILLTVDECVFKKLN
jgi:hypothetical protein